ncbi:MAG: glycoside hydrolase family 75 protein [Verrucomicrobiales bacterium]
MIYEDKVYPAIIGDAGPREKMGEASLRIAKEINDKANPYRRPVSDLKVTYLIFPQSADKPFRQPVLADWRERCAEFLNKIGGIGEGYTLHEWADRFHPKPPPEAAILSAPETWRQPPAN